MSLWKSMAAQVEHGGRRPSAVQCWTQGPWWWWWGHAAAAPPLPPPAHPATAVFLLFFLSTRGSPVSARIKRSPPFYGPQIFPFKTIPFFSLPWSVSETFSRHCRLMSRSSAHPPWKTWYRVWDLSTVKYLRLFWTAVRRTTLGLRG